MKINLRLEILNKSKVKRISIDYFVKAARICSEILKDKIKPSQVVSLVFVDSKEMKKLNKKYTDRRGITDVLSFNFDSEEYLGEIIICPSKDALVLPRALLPMEKNRPKSGKKEIKLILTRLLVHGILHLVGYNHEENIAEAKRMLVFENKIMEKLKARF